MKILITRSAPFSLFESALDEIKARYKDAKIFVLIQRSEKDALTAYGSDLIPIVINDGPFKIFKEGYSLVKDLRGKRFNISLLVYGNKAGYGYLNLDILSFLASPSEEWIYDTEKRFYKVSSPFLKILKKLFWASCGKILYAFIQLIVDIWSLFKKEKISSPLFAKTDKIKTSVLKTGKLKRSKIVMVDLMFTWPPHGGACVDLKEVASGLKNRGYEVELIVPDFQAIFPRGKVDSSSLSFNVHKIKFSKGTFNSHFLPKTIREKVKELAPDYVYLGDSYFLKPFLIEALKDYQIVSRFYTYELLCPNHYLLFRDGKRCESNYLKDPVGCLKCALTGMKKNIESMNWEVWSHEFMASLAFLPSYHSRVMEALPKCHTIITYNDLATALLSNYHSNVITMPGGVNINDFTPSGISNNRIKKIFVSGRLMDPRKGFNFFISAIIKLRKERNDFEVYVTYDKKFKEPYITSLGWINHDMIKKIYRDVDICVVPSLWEEPFGIVAVEAMASGKPVIASSVGGLTSSVENGVTGLLFPPGDENGLIKCLNRLLDEPELIQKMGEAGRNRVEHYFEWDRIISRYCDEVFV